MEKSFTLSRIADQIIFYQSFMAKPGCDGYPLPVEYGIGPDGTRWVAALR